MSIMTHAKFHFNWLMLTLIFGIWASEPPPGPGERLKRPGLIGLKEWVRSKLKALASLLGKLGMKAAEALPGITGGIVSWILNRAKDEVGNCLNLPKRNGQW